MGSLSDENSGNFRKIKDEKPGTDNEVLSDAAFFKEGGLVFSNDYNEVCKYMCPVCEQLVDRLKTHMISNHSSKVNGLKIPRKDYHKETYHKCGICERVILFTKVNIRNHVSQAHNLPILEYNDQFMKLKSDHMGKKINKNGKKMGVRRQSSYSSLILGDGGAYDKNVDESLLRNSYKDVCKLQCMLCEKKVDLDLFSVHLAKKHYQTFAEYKEKHGVPVLTTRTFHKCGVCGFIFLFTRVRISGHVTQKHHMTVKEYANQYLTKIHQGPGALEVNDEDVDRDVMYSNDYEDECKTICQVCHKECSSANLNSHAYQCHSIRSADYLAQFGPMELTKKAYHECAICHKTILFVRYHIAQHVKTKHGISLNEYNREHMQFHNVEYSENNLGERGRKVGHQKAPMWCDGTMYRCPYCHNIYYRYFTFRIHLIRSHEVRDPEERSKVVRENEMMTDTYACKICGQDIKKDRMDIEAHIKQVHKTTYRVYEANFESGKAGVDARAVVAKLVDAGIVAMPAKLPKKRGRNKMKGVEQIKPVPWRNVINASAASLLSGSDKCLDIKAHVDNINRIKEEDIKYKERGDNTNRIKEKDIKREVEYENHVQVELPAKRIRRVPAKLASDEFEVGIKNIANSVGRILEKKNSYLNTDKKTSSIKNSTESLTKMTESETKVSKPSSVKKLVTLSSFKSKSLTRNKNKTSPKEKTSPEPKLNKTNNNPKNQISSDNFIVTGIKNELEKSNKNTVERVPVTEGKVVEEVKKEVEECLMYKCPLPGCDWICTREGMRKGPAVLHLLRKHRIQPIEMRQRGIKFITLEST